MTRTVKTPGDINIDVNFVSSVFQRKVILFLFYIYFFRQMLCHTSFISWEFTLFLFSVKPHKYGRPVKIQSALFPSFKVFIEVEVA